VRAAYRYEEAHARDERRRNAGDLSAVGLRAEPLARAAVIPKVRCPVAPPQARRSALAYQRMVRWPTLPRRTWSARSRATLVFERLGGTAARAHLPNTSRGGRRTPGERDGPEEQLREHVRQRARHAEALDRPHHRRLVERAPAAASARRKLTRRPARPHTREQHVRDVLSKHALRGGSTVYLTVCLAPPPSPSHSLSLSLWLPLCLSMCLPLCVPLCLSLCVSHCVSLTVSSTVSLMCLPLSLPHRLSHCGINHRVRTTVTWQPVWLLLPPPAPVVVRAALPAGGCPPIQT
jgi:hypothetical protein